MFSDPTHSMLPKVQCPVLMVAAAGRAGTNPEYLQRRRQNVEAAQASMPKSRAVWIQDSGHDIGYEQPRESGLRHWGSSSRRRAPILEMGRCFPFVMPVQPAPHLMQGRASGRGERSPGGQVQLQCHAVLRRCTRHQRIWPASQCRRSQSQRTHTVTLQARSCSPPRVG